MRAVMLSNNTWELVSPETLVVQLTPFQAEKAKATGNLPEYPEIVQLLNCRWVTLSKKSPSGKTLFVCTCCGRTSVAPDKSCPDFCEKEEETW